MQDPNEDTVWNDVLRSVNILPPVERSTAEAILAGKDIPDPPKPEDETDTEKKLTDIINQAVDDFAKGMTLEEINKYEDDDLEDGRSFEKFRRQRMKELLEEQSGPFGEVVHISANEYVKEVNEAGDVWVVLHLYQEYLRSSKLVNIVLARLAQRHPHTKFLKIKSTDCIPGYPDENLPTILVYHQDELIHQYVGLPSLGGPGLTVDDIEWVLSKVGAVKTKLTENPIEKRCIAQLNLAMSGAFKDCSP